MSKLVDKTTLYLDPRVKKSVQYYALRDDRSLSDIVNEQLFEYLENMADLAALDAARSELSSTEAIPFEQVVKDLGLDINEIRNKVRAERQKTTKTSRP